ncbi:uncharacterized protein PHALS_07418 [Plasmopara halstedii]|uniref:Uncharacterized protein n=1 Tax=Plasmopara halstedii TaxID=4781 RepID=A0A0P1B630_PLAHL|nr:uncharacterized protein PHALS_07418 [Plasmopara halstedii]CEG49666.1 hypothetical protein PHALS_07418 [Plasmopara halstedii]|eukprot:XP_024586035.1 hypothetical protein PHALS_07418 [Plasmopara halstedii]
MVGTHEELDKQFVRAMTIDESEDEQQKDEKNQEYENALDNIDGFRNENQRHRRLSRSVSSLSSRSTASFENDNFLPYLESAAIQSKKYMARNQVKFVSEQEERMRRLKKNRVRRQNLEKWTQKTARSPFHVNLVADNERLDEEHRVNMIERARRARELERRAKEAKSEVILKALTETSDLDLLRREKRAIIDEEKRLKALLDLEKTNSHRKLDLLVARRAEKHRRQEKEDYRRRQRQQALKKREEQYKQLLREKLALDN